MQEQSMITKHISRILLVTGMVTMLPGLQFLAPTLYLANSGMAVGDDTGLFFARHWGLLVFLFGALLVFASRNEACRRPIVFAAAIEKCALVIMIALNWSNPALAGMQPAAVFDTLCLALYSAYLMSAPAKS